MNMHWDLNPLYESFDSKLFKDEMEKLDSISKDIVKWAENNLKDHKDSKNKIEYYLKYSIESDYLLDKLYRFIHLTIAVNSTDENARKYSDIIKEKVSFLTKPEVMFMKWMKNIDVEKEAENSELITEHLFILNEIKKQSKYMLSEDEEILISDMKRTSSSAWSMLQNSLISELTAEIDEKELPIAIVRAMSNDVSAEKRRKGYDAELKAYKKIEIPSSFCINSIKGEVISLSKKRGYKSPLQMTLINSRMSEEILNTMLKAIKGKLPIFRKYLRKKAEILGYKNGLPFYDLDAPMGKSDRKFT
ncbi:oligoendopeptidase F, partial [candidate division WOR-3 bacterium]|nr:oligoendopeptidase F [candidate division WOR-3 bacterium]